MKFAVLQFFSWPERRVELPTVYQRALDRVKIMDQNGYDAVWLAEHHFSTYSVCPSVHMMGMHIANITEKIRIGTAVSLAAFYHPLRLAEEVALLDVLSGGRVNWGAGRGFDKKEMEVFDVAADESYPRFRENVEIVLKCFEEGKMTHHGEFHDYEDVEVLPKPTQNPMPYWVASSSPPAIEWAASQGHAILMDPHAPHTTMHEKVNLYRQGLAASGKTNTQDTPIARLIAIAKTDKEAEEIARNGAQWTVASYANPKGEKKSSYGEAPAVEDPVQRYVDEVIIHGSPAKVIDKLKQLEEEIPLNYLLASPLSHESFMRLTDEVMPHMATSPAVAASS